MKYTRQYDDLGNVTAEIFVNKVRCDETEIQTNNRTEFHYYYDNMNRRYIYTEEDYQNEILTYSSVLKYDYFYDAKGNLTQEIANLYSSNKDYIDLVILPNMEPEDIDSYIYENHYDEYGNLQKVYFNGTDNFTEYKYKNGILVSKNYGNNIRSDFIYEQGKIINEKIYAGEILYAIYEYHHYSDILITKKLQSPDGNKQKWRVFSYNRFSATVDVCEEVLTAEIVDNIAKYVISQFPETEVIYFQIGDGLRIVDDWTFKDDISIAIGKMRELNNIGIILVLY